jgi:hypothetical protein
MEPSELDPERGVKVTAMLADYAAAADGKLTAVGAGWNVTGPQPVPFAIALLVEVPWHLTNKQHTVRLELIDLDGNPVTPTGADEPQTIELQFEIGRPPGLRPGTMLPVPLPINHGPMSLPPGGHYEWRLTVNGEAHEDWRLAFSTRPDAQSEAA